MYLAELNRRVPDILLVVVLLGVGAEVDHTVCGRSSAATVVLSSLAHLDWTLGQYSVWQPKTANSLELEWLIGQSSLFCILLFYCYIVTIISTTLQSWYAVGVILQSVGSVRD